MHEVLRRFIALVICEHDDIIMAAAFGDQQRVFRKDSVLDTYVEETFRLMIGTLTTEGEYALPTLNTISAKLRPMSP